MARHHTISLIDQTRPDVAAFEAPLPVAFVATFIGDQVKVAHGKSAGYLEEKCVRVCGVRVENCWRIWVAISGGAEASQRRMKLRDERWGNFTSEKNSSH